MQHAYLIIAHNDFSILEKSILLLDDVHNDFYIHIDKKVKNFDFNYFKNLVKKSNVYFVKRINVCWGSFSQIACEYLLLKAAYKKHYDYYHLISGADMPIASNDIIYNFFKTNNGKEFVAFDNHDKINDDVLARIKYYHFFVPFAKSKNRLLRNVFNFFHYYFIRIENILNINRTKNCLFKFRKGANWVSITDRFASYVIKQEKIIKKYFKYSYCADELFIQTILYNSDFYKNVYSNNNDDYLGIKRCIDWSRGNPYTFKMEDFDYLVTSNCFWARKFSTKIDDKIIDEIYNYVKEKNDGKS